MADDFLKEEDRDLGFGTVVSGQSRQRLLNPDGSFNVQRTGLPLFTSLNLYHSLLTMKWRTFLLLVLLLYFLSKAYYCYKQQQICYDNFFHDDKF